MVQSRIASFCGGFAVAAGLGLWAVRKDIWASHNLLAAQTKDLEKRVAALEAGNK
eukprot:CAMPEP_0197848352 /NCGR_PEP_ID=MMETSP1438-20131217/8431_1 /TAXON_ID=1461541 /ORGANISM="Pterosperma sp., Strain CCMP1384" /LENGTH=54 /DNA_ID=CAMNT_0043460547 /DNA_START=93 /DNA_END=257 /DNA_ORIENTATION=-